MRAKELATKKRPAMGMTPVRLVSFLSMSGYSRNLTLTGALDYNKARWRTLSATKSVNLLMFRMTGGGQIKHALNPEYGIPVPHL